LVRDGGASTCEEEVALAERVAGTPKRGPPSMESRSSPIAPGRPVPRRLALWLPPTRASRSRMAAPAACVRWRGSRVAQLPEVVLRRQACWAIGPVPSRALVGADRDHAPTARAAGGFVSRVRPDAGTASRLEITGYEPTAPGSPQHGSAKIHAATTLRQLPLRCRFSLQSAAMAPTGCRARRPEVVETPTYCRFSTCP
jgi:hypothetical protein